MAITFVYIKIKVCGIEKKIWCQVKLTPYK